MTITLTIKGGGVNEDLAQALEDVIGFLRTGMSEGESGLILKDGCYLEWRASLGKALNTPTQASMDAYLAQIDGRTGEVLNAVKLP